MIGADELSRTVRLVQVELGITGNESIILRALTGVTFCLIADADWVSSYPGQLMVATAAMLMARSGHTVFVDTPDAPLLDSQPPFAGSSFHNALTEFGGDLLTMPVIKIGRPLAPATIGFVFGTPRAGLGVQAKRLVGVGADDWRGNISRWPKGTLQPRSGWPIGPLAAASLAATEAFKAACEPLISLSRDPRYAAELLGPTENATIDLAPADTLKISDVGDLDLISAGAISNSVLYTLLRIPNVIGSVRTFDNDHSEISNLNRNALLRRSDILDAATGRDPKVGLFARYANGLAVVPVEEHFSTHGIDRRGGLRESVIMGVDSIEARWDASRQSPKWLGVGATAGFSSMASAHVRSSPCAGCLYDAGDENERIVPTVSFVSFLAGLMVTTMFLRSLSDTATTYTGQKFLTSLHPAGGFDAPIQPRAGCPVGCSSSRMMVA